jgi:shikimate kinase/3-dehydroquinate synthase
MATPLFLVGFMGAGKTTVGTRIAAASARRFVDLDDAIAAAGGRPTAELVAADEPAFRRLEAETLATLVTEASRAGDGLVIATGGGAAAHGDNLARMRAAGVVVALSASPRAVLARCGRSSGRPLLPTSTTEVATLMRRREPSYRRAHAVVDTDDLAPDAVAARVLEVEATWARARPHDVATILALADRTSPVVVTPAALDGALVRRFLGDRIGRVALVTDDNVAAAWAQPAHIALADAGLDVRVVTVPAGEASKSFATYQRVCEQLVAAGLDRSGAVIALGGGVVGDLAGFAAATLFRGVPVVQLPTTLVAMTDSAIGGKTGIDLPAGKNLIGAFWQPRLVAAHLPVLATLPSRERRAAFGELWKYALLDGAETWAAVDAIAPWAAAGGAEVPAEVGAVVERCARYKGWIVSRDEREVKGERALLNLGHTVGHAIEAEAGWRLLHGECIALGLVASCRVSAALGLVDASLEVRVADAVRRSGLDADLDPWLTDAVLARIGYDKKRTGNRIGFVAVREVGGCEVVPIDSDELSRILRPRAAL